MTDAAEDRQVYDRQWLRRRLAESHSLTAFRPEAGDDLSGLRPTDHSLKPAAVLVGIVAHDREPMLLLTQRTAHLKAHAGQISFPGGRVEPGDKDPADTALREAWEEIGLDPEEVEILGELPSYETVTGFRIHPVVGWIVPPVTFTIDPFEVAELFEVPFHFVLDPVNHRQDSYVRDGRRRHFYVLPYANRYIWGATAGILVSFARLLAAKA